LLSLYKGKECHSAIDKSDILRLGGAEVSTYHDLLHNFKLWSWIIDRQFLIFGSEKEKFSCPWDHAEFTDIVLF
jgi:hypothetical protein